MAFGLLKEVENDCFSKASSAYFPPILDEDPVLAAKALAIDDSIIAMNAMKSSYTSISNNEEGAYPYLQEAISCSYTNFVWFASFFKELQKLYSSSEFKIPYEAIPDPEVSKQVLIIPPIYTVKIGDTYKVFYENFDINRPTILNKYRISYISKRYELEDFRCGFPNWYILRSTTIFEKYNEKVNKRVKITFQDGEFRYFISGASDNWEEILDVPLEIDDVVAAILFRN